ncbi:Stealth CR1 domain-containing protein [Cronobacter dublinensis]
MRKLRKFFTNPPIFLRDYFNKKYPPVYNQILCPADEEQIIIKNDALLESLVDNNLSIDVVFTWVDDSDPLWREKYNRYRYGDSYKYNNAPCDSARYRNHNEIFYAIKSVTKHLPWVNQIFLVTDNPCPEWVSCFKNVKVVNHSMIIDEKYLPTFNSHVIEANLHKIKGLQEYFIYFNDDVFVARNLSRSHFFKANGIASLFSSFKDIEFLKNKKRVTPTLYASLNSAQLLRKKFDFNSAHPLVHTYVPLQRSQFQAVWEDFEKEIELFLSNRFRDKTDLNLPTFLVPWYSYINGKAALCRDICYYFNIRSPAASTYYRKLKSAKLEGTFPHSICANDFMSTSRDVHDYSLILQDSLKMITED